MVNTNNASISIETAYGPVLTSVFMKDYEPVKVATILLDKYNLEGEALELIIRGDFHQIKPNLVDCLHTYTLGENAQDCAPEIFGSLEDLLDALHRAPHTYNYVYSKGRWYLIDVTTQELISLADKINQPRKKE